METKEIWRGLFHVIPPEGLEGFEGDLGSYVNVLAFSNSYHEFIKYATEYLEFYEFSVVEYQDVKVLILIDNFAEDWCRALDALSPQQPIQLTNFQSYSDDSDE